MTLINHGAADLKIEALNIEDLCSTDWHSMFGKTDLIIYNNYGRMKHIGHYVGDWDDALVVFHNTTLRAGMALGNETPGVLKRVAYQVEGSANIQAGTTHPGQDFPFRKWLKPGEAWESPATFVALYDHSDNGTEVINGTVNTYVRKYMGTRLAQITSKPGFVYNTWNPFRTFLTDALIRDVAKAAAECGIQEFVIDDGWQVNAGGKTSSKMVGENYGDWLVDRKKFPDDLKATFDYIRSLGMKPGLWISIGTATSDSKVFKEHPEWFVKNIKGEPGNLHTLSSSQLRTACLGTDWFAYIKGVILSLVKEHGLAYAKLDLSILTSAYVDDIRISGCYAKDHPAHRDHEESFIAIYERVMQLFDELHKEAPGLFIDCTFETVGKLQSIDYAFCKHAEGNWISNFEQPYPTGALRVRQMAWWRSPAMPASALVVGNQTMDGEKFIYTLKSLMGTLPIVLGDPRKLSTAQRAEIKGWSDWMLAMQKKYNYMAFRQDLPGFGEPQEGAWDGWQRLNTESKGGGIVGVFKQGAREASRTVFVSGLDPAAEYVVHMAPCNKEVVRCSGQQLMEVGFVVTISGLYDGDIYAVEKCN